MDVTFLFFGRSGRKIPLRANPIWTLNDWYSRFSDIKPERVYNIHRDFSGHATDKSRFPGDWITEYNKSGAEIVTRNWVDGLNRQRVFDDRRGINEFGYSFFGGTFSYMFAEAVWAGVKRVFCVGMDLIGDEYATQVPFAIMAIDKCREMGIEVVAEREKIWRSTPVDWAKINDISLMYGNEKMYGNYKWIPPQL